MNTPLRPGMRAMVLLACVSGCGAEEDTGPKLDLVPVTGSVSLDGQPLEGATVSYVLQGTAPAGFYGSGALSDAQGKFTLMTGDKPGTVAGDYKVFVSKMVMKDGSTVKLDPESGIDMQMLEMQGDAKQLIPPQFSNPLQTTLTATVTATGPNEHKHEVTSK